MKLYHGDIYRVCNMQFIQYHLKADNMTTNQSNVFVDKLENGDPIALLGDFGQSGDLESESNVATFMSERPFHIAPELYKHFVRSNLRRTTCQTVETDALIERIHLMEKGDVYALGILAWEVSSLSGSTSLVLNTTTIRCTLVHNRLTTITFNTRTNWQPPQQKPLTSSFNSLRECPMLYFRRFRVGQTFFPRKGLAWQK
jgi:hypothetical protein